MNTGLISTRYAKALLDHAIASGEQQEVYHRMKTLAAMFIEQPALRRALSGAVNTREKKIFLLRTASGGDLPPSLERMLGLIMENEREELIHYIALRYTELYRDRAPCSVGRYSGSAPPVRSP